MSWQPIETAPKDGTHVALVTRGGSVVRAEWQDTNDWNTWVATNEGEHPLSWDDGVCWAFNSDNEPSDPPIAWMPLPDPLVTRATEGT
jgi:hypothetical protein